MSKQKHQIIDFEEEHDAKVKLIKEQEMCIKKLELKDSQSSLSEELKAANFQEEKVKLEIQIEDLEKKVKQFEVNEAEKNVLDKTEERNNNLHLSQSGEF